MKVRPILGMFGLFLAVATELSAQNTVTRFENIRVCSEFSGSDAGAKIAACISDLPSTGGTADARGLVGAQNIDTQVAINKSGPVTLLLGSATFTMTKRFYIQSSAVQIIGCGMGCTTLFASASILEADNDLILVSFGGIYPSPATAISNIIITDLTVDGNQSGVTTGRPYANDTHGQGINLNRCQSCKVLHTEVKNIINQAIVHTGNIADDANDGEIAGSIIASFGEIGIGIENHSSRWNVHNNVVKTGITNRENSNGPNAGIYVGCTGCSGGRSVDNIVSSNSVFNIVPAGGGATGTGIGIKVDEYADRTHVTGNDIEYARPCIRVLAQTAASIANNVHIVDNKCFNSRATDTGAIDISAGATVPTGFLVANNHITSSLGGGITMTGVAVSSIIGNQINGAGAGAGAEQNGIALYGASSLNIIVGNFVSGASGVGTLINSSAVVDTLLATNNLASNTRGAYRDNGTRTTLACNKFNASDEICRMSPISVQAIASRESLFLDGAANQWTQRMMASATTGQSFGLRVSAGTNSSDTAFSVRSQAGTDYMVVRGDGIAQLNGGGRTFASTPTCNGSSAGSLTVITDSNTTTWGATVAGSGSNRVLAYCNGSNWTVAGK